MTLTEFLLARIAEDEAAARDVVPSEWAFDVTADRRFEAYNDHVEVGVARVLAECEAKRRIVERCRPQYAILYRESERLLASAFDQETVQTVGHGGPMWPFVGAEDILRFLTLPYADHPDYDPAWRVPAE